MWNQTVKMSRKVRSELREFIWHFVFVANWSKKKISKKSSKQLRSKYFTIFLVSFQICSQYTEVWHSCNAKKFVLKWKLSFIRDVWLRFWLSTVFFCLIKEIRSSLVSSISSFYIKQHCKKTEQREHMSIQFETANFQLSSL